MKKFGLATAKKFLDARSFNERVLLLATLVALMGFATLELVWDPVSARQAALEREIAAVQGRIEEQLARQREIEDSFSRDPNAFARSRLGQLQSETMAVDNRLNELYGQLIAPQEMSLVLTSILQKETALRLVTLENIEPESLFQADVSPVPLVGPAPAQVAASLGEGMEVYRHGLRMVFEGGFLDTLYFLRSVEELENKFFWDELSYSVQEYPTGRITLQIYTLSTQQEWLGV